MGSALLDTGQLDTEASSDSPSEASHATARATAPPASEALHHQVAERLAAHRSRRNQAQPSLALSPAPSAPSRTSRIAAAVAQRYAHSPSYRAYLAAEAERATQQAQAAAQIAALNAQAVAQAQQLLLDSLNDEAPSSAAAPSSPNVEPTESRSHHVPADSHPFAPPLSGITVRIFEDDGLPASMPGAEHRNLASPPHVSNASRLLQQQDHLAAEARLLDEEIAFRQSPVFEEPAGPPMPLPTNLIEFPRQLVAPRKARPRYAEGPLRTAASLALGESQLRIFEVDPAQISTIPVPAEAPTPQWTSIWLDAPNPTPAESAPASSLLSSHRDDSLSSHSNDYLSSRTLSEVEGEGSAFSARPAPLPHIASIPRRLMAAAIDTSVLFAGFLAFAAAFLFSAGRSNLWQPAAAISDASFPLDRHPALARLAVQFTAHTGLQPGLALASSLLVLALLYLLYQALFFSFSESTPGMRCARIALCTFDDENPTRGAMRRRNLAVLLSACPLGLGLLWAAFDEDRLTWHDRLTRTYQRIY
jgi:uncharacterized RDD family membrane protein YckC